MTTSGPKPVRIADKEWRGFLASKNVKPWYSLGGRFFLPGAFVHTDGDGEPDEQDTMWAKQSLWLRAKQALALGYGCIDSLAEAYREDGFRGIRLWWALDLIQHEHSHLLVPGKAMVEEGLTSPEERQWFLRWCSHPAEARPALKHAKQTGFRTNAFTRLLRWRSSQYRRFEFLEWFSAAE